MRVGGRRGESFVGRGYDLFQASSQFFDDSGLHLHLHVLLILVQMRVTRGMMRGGGGRGIPSILDLARGSEHALSRRLHHFPGDEAEGLPLTVLCEGARTRRHRVQWTLGFRNLRRNCNSLFRNQNQNLYYAIDNVFLQ